MPVLKSCLCGCASLRTGTQIIIIWIIVVSLMRAAKAASSDSKQSTLGDTLAYVGAAITLICGIIGWMGIQNNNPKMLIPAMLAFLFILNVLSSDCTDCNESSNLYQTAAIVIFVILPSVYLFLVMFSYYQQMQGR